METMQQTGSDFTDTFRLLGEIKSNGNMEEVLQKFLTACAPRKLLEKKPAAKYSPAELVKIEQILER
jgi:hypothetical protein